MLYDQDGMYVIRCIYTNYIKIHIHIAIGACIIHPRLIEMVNEKYGITKSQ